MDSPSPFGSFHEAAHGVLKHLHAVLGFDLWMVTRTEGNDWIVLEAEDHGYNVKRGDVFRWTDSFCSRMVEGLGPQVAPRAAQVPAYAAAPVGQQAPIGAYVGAPLSWKDGQLFGTLCAIHPTPRPASIAEEMPTVELFARLLTSILEAEYRATEQARRAERAQTEALTDCLTGLYNRRGWNRLLRTEEARSRRYGHPACMISLDIDHLKTTNDLHGHTRGDDLIRCAATAIRQSVREQDVAARIGGDEFAVMCVECDAAREREIAQRIERRLVESGVRASIGMAHCHPRQTFAEAWEQADQAMYAVKRQRYEEPLTGCRSQWPLADGLEPATLALPLTGSAEIALSRPPTAEQTTC